MKKYSLIFILFVLLGGSALADIHLAIPNPETWTVAQLTNYVGETVVFDQPMYITNNYSSTLSVAPRRIFAPTNQAYPLSTDYTHLLSLNNMGQMALTNVSGYHRCGEKIYNLRASVLSTNRLRFLSGDFVGNTREELEKGIPNVDIKGTHRLLVCTMNLEYYLAAGVSTSSMGPNSKSEHQKQRTKISKALAKINADIYGFVEIEQGDVALQEIADDLSANTKRHFDIISDGSQPNGTITKSGFVYCSDMVEPYGALQENNAELNDRKKVQAFREKATGEIFLFSVNHFKAKISGGAGLDLDQGDGQGYFNHKRTLEAQSIINQYGRLKALFKESDILVMGDMNAYAKEDPITTMTNAGFIDLHRAFHADSSYSYSYNGTAGYLDHALSNGTLYPQITGMCAYHINSDESDNYTYDKSDDLTMFRCSDHDPIIVGLALDSTLTFNPHPSVNSIEMIEGKNTLTIYNALRNNYRKSFYTIHSINGVLLQHGEITSNDFNLERPQTSGIYILNIFAEQTVFLHKIIVP